MTDFDKSVHDVSGRHSTVNFVRTNSSISGASRILTKPPPMNWRIQGAEARFGEMVNRAVVTRHGKRVAILNHAVRGATARQWARTNFDKSGARVSSQYLTVKFDQLLVTLPLSVLYQESHPAAHTERASSACTVAL